MSRLQTYTTASLPTTPVRPRISDLIVPAHISTSRYEGKSLRVAATQAGDLLVSGYAVVWPTNVGGKWRGLDGQDEGFTPGSVRAAAAAFLKGSAPLCSSQTGTVLGRVISLTEDSVGVRIEARIDRQDPSSPLYPIYSAVKRGSIRGFSVAACSTARWSRARCSLRTCADWSKCGSAAPSSPLTLMDSLIEAH